MSCHHRQSRRSQHRRPVASLDRLAFTAVPMLIMALAIIPLLLIPLLADLSAADSLFVTLDWVIWALFAIEYVARLVLSPHRWWLVRHNIIDLLFVLLPFLRPLRLARSARALRLIRAGRGVVLGRRRARSGRRSTSRTTS